MTFCDIDYPSVPILAVLPVRTSLCIYLCICSMSTINLQCNFHCRSLPLLLFISLLPFYPHPRASAFEEIQFEILPCIFHEPNLFWFFLYPVLCCSLEKMFHWHCMGMPVVVLVCVYRLACFYVQAVCSLILEGDYSRSLLKFNTINKKPTLSQREARVLSLPLLVLYPRSLPAQPVISISDPP